MNLTDLQALKCKTCGEPLDLGKANDGVIKCAVCDSCFTLPKAEADQKVLDYLFQAEGDLDTGKFEEAYTKFAKAAELDKTEPEAYWGMALAESKIQYLKDEVNNRLQPICHEINDKVFSDGANFLKAIRYATNAQRDEYEKKGEEIDRVKKEFYRIKQTGLDYDCFICVKVTDEHGGRTADYKTADDIYFELKGKGYKPFFSERELGNVTGADYEARILYALYSSECMLVVCFDEAYLRTKWVKNEYTRFLKLVNDEEKESDSVALVFKDKPIEKLPGKHGKIQGVSLNSLTAMERIVSFVESHTPEARKRREEQAKQKDGENEALKKKLAEQEERFKKLEEMLSAQQGAPRQAEEERERKEIDIAAQARQELELNTNVDDFEIVNCDLKRYKGNSSNVVIPSGVVSISGCEIEDDYGSSWYNGAFEESEVESVKIPNSVTSIGEDVFRNCSRLKSFMVPKSVVSISLGVLAGCKSVEQICVENANPKYLSRSNCLLTKDGRVLVMGCKTSVVPLGVTSIGERAFYSCEKLANITIPNSVTEICESAFQYCSELKSIAIPGSVINIGDWAFADCSKLQTVTLNDGLLRIGMNAFEDCENLTKIIIPNSVTSIDECAFYWCKNLTIFCRAEKKPMGWHKDWCKKEDKLFGSRHKVVWGYKGN